MKTLAITTILTFALALPLAHAGEAHDSGRHGNGSGMGMHKDTTEKSGMHEHMQAMRQTMQQIHETEDPEKRQRLMKKHMQQMHEAMGNMHGMMGDDAKHQKMQQMDPEKRQQMMHKHKKMMQEMMEQMQAHMQAQESMDQDD
ncbi:hypothetical protein PC39_14552 [Salinisphaera sp. PC39]|uniref:hypothetical protein n=1 Tax=Salinisphaera sp. PC39 TaxID=1304156 RepID=UPI003340D298